MLQLQNNSPFEASLALMPDVRGIDALIVVIKGSFVIGASLSLAPEQRPLMLEDEYWGEAGASSVKYAGDVHLPKPGTDVALIGQAFVPGGAKAAAIDVSFNIAERSKTLRVSGPRVWQNGTISKPEPFERMPIVYEYAYGGRTDEGADEQNPVGRGYTGKQSPKALDGQPVPNIEDPAHLLENGPRTAVPAGFGFIAPSWWSRRRFAGTYDDTWQATRAPYLPDDFDSRFFNAAHPDLVFDRFLTGGENVELINLSRRGRLEFAVPGCAFTVAAKMGSKRERLEVNLDTILVETEDDRLVLTWRAVLPCDKQALEIDSVTIDLASMSHVVGAR